MADLWSELARQIARNNALRAAPQKFFQDSLQKVKVDLVRSQVEGSIAPGNKALKTLLTDGKLTSPEAAATAAGVWELNANAAYLTANVAIIAAEILSAGQVDITLAKLLELPHMRAWFSTAEEISRAEAEGGLLPLLRQYHLNKFKPMVPGSGDIVRMVVREAFDPKMVIEAPSEFVTSMGYAGFNKTWCDRFWTAHFEPIALQQAYWNLWRGDWKKEDFMYALHIADVHPMWREAIYRVAFRAPGVRELGYGYDTNLYDRDDIVKYRRWGGLSLEDAEKAADATIAYRLEAERNSLRTEAMYDFTNYLDDEAQLRANLTAIGGRPEVIELWVARAKFRRDRDFTLDMAKVSSDQHVKGYITETELSQDLRDLGIDPTGRAKMIAEAKTRRLKTVREEAAASAKIMPESRVRKARELGLIDNEDFVNRLMDHGYTEKDARLDLAIELTPMPLTDEEIERRATTITSRKAKAARRHESTLAKIQNQIDLADTQLEDARTIAKETLDVIDAQIEAYDMELPTATPARAAALERLHRVQEQRRELQEARSTATIKKLTAQISDLQETLATSEKQRDEELSEYDEELKLLGAAA